MMFRNCPKKFSIVAAFCALSSIVLAQNVPATQPKSDFLPFEEVTKDMEAVSGLMTFYRYKESDPTKDQTKLLCVVPRSLMKQDMLFAVSISRGSYAGFQWVDGLVRWEQIGKQIALVAPDTRFVNRPGSPINDAVQRTYRPSFIFATPIITMTPGGDPVIDISEALFTPAVQLPYFMRGGVRRDISRLEMVKSFPENVLVDVDLAMSLGNGGSSMGLSYAFRKLPDASSYRPRKADERVGYFTTDHQDWTVKYSEREMIQRYVNRWDLRKKDPSLDLSPPEKPITFIIEKGVPLQWRRYVSEGILEWNKAFEKIGIVGAIVVQQQADDNEFANTDPSDSRYNYIVWTVRNSVMAMGPSRADPRTGQILDADIVMDDAWVRYFNESSELFTPKAHTASMNLRKLRFLEKHPSFLPPSLKLDQVKQALKESDEELMKSDDSQEGISSILSPNRSNIGQRCDVAMGLTQQISLAQLVGLQAKAGGLPKIPDHLIGSAIREIIMHEVGHTLGLRHNFKASSWLSLDQAKTNRDANLPFVASVMDYNPLLFYPNDQLDKVKSFATTTIGPYDNWAIEYGYGVSREPDKEAEMLKQTLAKSTLKENAYGTDEETFGMMSPDPLTSVYDMSDDPIAWSKHQIALTDSLLKNVRNWAQTPEEPNHYLRRAYLQLIMERAGNLEYVSRLVGGQYFSRARASDPNAPAPLTLVDAKQQREAIKIISQTVLSDDFYKADADLLNRLVPSRWWRWDSFPVIRLDYPFYDITERQYMWTLMNLTDPDVLQRIYDAEVKTTSEDKFTAAELVKSVRDTIWSELDSQPSETTSDAKPYISAVRRGMQNTHLGYLVAIAETEPGDLVSSDLRNLVRYGLRELSDKIGKSLQTNKIDFATKGHLVEAKSRIDRTLDKPIINNMGGGEIILLIGQDGKVINQKK